MFVTVAVALARARGGALLLSRKEGPCEEPRAPLGVVAVKISLVHPSRGRVERAEAAAQEWASRARGPHAREHLLSVDDDDPALAGYRALAERAHLTLLSGPNRTMVEAVNRAAALASGDLIVVVSDDFGCPEGWDDLLAGVARPGSAVFVHDAIAGRIMTLPVLTRAFYERVGHVYHPAYLSLWADDELTAVAAQSGALVDARHLVFPHRHFHADPGVFDPTYAWQNRAEAWWHGWRVFEQRKLTAFGTRPRTVAVRLSEARIAAYAALRRTASRLRQAVRPHLPQAATPAESVLCRAGLALLRLLTPVDPRG